MTDLNVMGFSERSDPLCMTDLSADASADHGGVLKLGESERLEVLWERITRWCLRVGEHRKAQSAVCFRVGRVLGCKNRMDVWRVGEEMAILTMQRSSSKERRKKEEKGHRMKETIHSSDVYDLPLWFPGIW